MVLSAFCEGRDFLPRQRVVPGNYRHTTQNYYTDSITCMICRCNVQMREQPEMLLTRLAGGALMDQVSEAIWWNTLHGTIGKHQYVPLSTLAS